VRTRCGGRWTEARYRSHIINALRSASMRWAPKGDCIHAAFVANGLNPTTGRKCKLHRCVECGELFPKGSMRADHIEPVVDPATGFQTWDIYIARMFVEQHEYQAVCVGCHRLKTAQEGKLRTGKLTLTTAMRKRKPRKFAG
jgi:5-methylcytosine-specific restriction endonuclease McrA